MDRDEFSGQTSLSQFILKISIVSINYAPEPTGIAVYSTGMAEYLAEAGHQITVFTAFSYYPTWKKAERDRGRLAATEQINGVRVKRSYIYVPKQPTAGHRILHELSFVCSAALRFALTDPGEVTIVVTPPLLLGAVIGILGKLKRTKLLLHVQDLQPDAAIDLGMLKPGLLTRVLFAIENAGYSLASRVSTISGAMCTRIESKGVPVSKCMLLKNWANDDLIRPMSASESFRSAFGLEERFVVLYSGNMGVKQGLGMLLDAAESLRMEQSIVFLIVGAGGEKDALMARARKQQLENVRFISPVAKEELGRLLATADVSVITQKAGIDDLVLPSKLGNILASCRPVIASTQIGSELASIIANAGCGLVIPTEDGAALAGALKTLAADSATCVNMAKQGVVYAREHLGRAQILSQFESELQILASAS